MCKPRIREATQPQTPFEGETIRLERRAAGTQEIERRAQGHCGGGWWWLWLIWPLFGVGKWLVPLLASGLATLAQATLTIPLLVPLALIVAGLLLLRR